MSELNPKQEAFLDALFGEARGHVPTALEMAGYHKHSYIVARNLKEAILERATDILALHAAGAVHAMGDAVDPENSTSPGISMRLAAAKEILDRLGIVKQDKVAITSDSPIGLFILPAKEPINGSTDEPS